MYSNLKHINKIENCSNLETVLIKVLLLCKYLIRKINSDWLVNKPKMIKKLLEKQNICKNNLKNTLLLFWNLLWNSPLKSVVIEALRLR